MEPFNCTIGVDFRITSLELEGKIVKLPIWDTAWEERFRTITSSYCRGAHGILLCYDLHVRVSFLRLAGWLEEVRKHASPNVHLMLIGNKADLDAQRAVTFEEGQAFADANGMPFMETSAKDDIHVSQANLKERTSFDVRTDTASACNHMKT